MPANRLAAVPRGGRFHHIMDGGLRCPVWRSRQPRPPSVRRTTVKKSAGTLLYRQGADGLEVLIVHPSGGYNRNKPWSIPKGIPDPGEDDLAATARRETWEETGVRAGELAPLGSITYTK